MELKTAMILAAGYGTRLLPKTQDLPKALVEVYGKPMISRVIERLSIFGIENIVVNAHHFAEQMVNYFAVNDFGVKISLNIEDKILGTGGGIKNAYEYLKDAENFLVHNVDVDSDIDFSAMFEFHTERKPLASLAVKNRDTSRPLLIDEGQNIIGRRIDGEDLDFVPAAGRINLTAFCGVHIVSSDIFGFFPDKAEFDIVDFYMELIEKGISICGFDVNNAKWSDLGKFTDLK